MGREGEEGDGERGGGGEKGVRWGGEGRGEGVRVEREEV